VHRGVGTRYKEGCNNIVEQHHGRCHGIATFRRSWYILIIYYIIIIIIIVIYYIIIYYIIIIIIY